MATSTLPQSVAEGFELSPQQRRSWHLQKTHSGLCLGSQCRVKIHGPVNAATLQQAISGLRMRHEILRTEFGLLDGTSVPVQVICDSVTGLDDVRDLSRQGESERLAELARMAEHSLHRLEDLSQAGAFLTSLAILSPSEHVLLITASALCADAAALSRIVRELAEIVANDAAPDDVMQYADLAEWQNHLFRAAAVDGPKPYWKGNDFSELSFPKLPFERRSASGVVPGRGFIHTPLPMALAASLNTLSLQLGTSLPPLLLTAWQILLQRFSRTDRFVIGAVVEGSSHSELRNSIGPFAKVLPIQANLDERAPFKEAAARLKLALELADRQHLQFDWDFGKPASSEHGCLFPMLFSVRERESAYVRGQLRWEVLSVAETLEPSQLAASITLGCGSAELEVDWDAAAYADTDIELLSDAYVQLLHGIVNQPDCAIGTLPAGAPFVRPLQLHAEAGLAAESEFVPLHSLIEMQARSAPDRDAIVCGGVRLSYGELDRRASVLANRLCVAGVRAETIVAISAVRSVDFFAGLLAVLKCGAAWLPIEPDTPSERVQNILAQANAVAILRLKDDALAMGGYTGPVIFLDDTLGCEPATPGSRVHPRQLAYVIFTSGSTGEPKGVGIEHAQIAAYLHAIRTRVDIPAGGNFALVSTLAADLGHTATFLALTSGGCLHVISSSMATDLDAIAEYFVRHQIQFMKIVPAHLEALCRSFPAGLRLPWRQLVVGGEALTWDVVELARRFAPDCKILNHYGPTETTVGILCGPAEPGSAPFLGGNVPIGQPLPGATAYVLDENLRPLPLWIAGELYLAGQLVGRGYAGRGDLTAERFLPDPFAPNPGARMYRTGDRARFRSDGSVEFLGRRDGQVKLRGYRLELGEVEAALARHPEVHRCAAAILDTEGGKQLVVWAAVGQSMVASSELRLFLERSLPSYMVPARVVCVERLQLTRNGKVDRDALPAAIPEPVQSKFMGPADEVEENLLAVWRQVLGVDQIGVTDNYFSLGGDSLRVIQLVQEMRKQGMSLSAGDVLRNQTVRQLRNVLRDKTHQDLFPNGIPPLTGTAEANDIYPVTGMQSFVIEEYSRNKGSRGVYHIQESLRLRDETLSIQALDEAFHLIVDRHPAMRTVFDMTSNPPMQRVRSDLQWSVRVEDISTLTTEAQDDYIAALLISDRTRLFQHSDLETPLFRVAVYRRSAVEIELFFSCHHAILDGWGHRVMTNQLFHAYSKLKAGSQPELGEPDRACGEFAAFQDAVRRSPRARDFWQNYLRDLEVPVLAPPSAVVSETAAPEDTAFVRALQPQAAEELVRLARQLGVSMQALLLGAWMETLRSWSGDEMAVSGVVSNGRSEYLSDPLSAVGLFWNVVPVVSRERLPLLETVAAVQRDLIEMAPFSAYPYSQLLADNGGRELLYAAFRYLNFWNAESVPEDSGVRVVDAQVYDLYSFPLTCTAFFNSASTGGYLIVQYHPESISPTRARQAFDRYYEMVEQMLTLSAEPSESLLARAALS